MRAIATIAVVMVSLVHVPAVLADEPTEASRLYDLGLDHANAGRFAEACAAFEKSIAKDPRQLGALLQLGRCNNELGKTAAALRYYRMARDLAKEAGKARSGAEAEAQITAIEPEVPRITFVRAGSPYPGEKLVVDEDVVSPTEPLDLDPGTHSVTLTAPGRLPNEQRVTLAPRERKQVRLPELAIPRSSVTTRRRSPRRLAGQVMTFAGLGLAVVGAAVAYYGKRDYDALFESEVPHCGLYPDIGGKAACDEYGVSLSDRDRTLITVGTIGASVGVAAALVGVVLWATAPSETSHTRVVPVVTDEGASVIVERTYRW